MVLLKGAVIILELFVIPLLAGQLLSCMHASAKGKDNIIENYLIGFFLILAVFWALYISSALLKLSFRALVYMFSFTMAALCLFSFFVSYRNKEEFVCRRKHITFSRFEIIYLLIFTILLGVQIYFAVFGDVTVYSYDDYSYVTRATDALSGNTLQPIDAVSGYATGINAKRILNSWEIFIAFLAKTSGFHVTTVSHTVLPAFLLLTAYMTYYYAAEKLFDKRENRLVFLILLSIAHIFGLYSHYSLTFRLLSTLWQGKAVLSAIVVPFFIAFLPEVYEAKTNARSILSLLIISMAACSLTMMGAGTALIVYGAMLTVVSLRQKRLTGIMYTLCGCSIPTAQMLLYLILR